METSLCIEPRSPLSTAPFRNVVIVGPGLMGGSLGMALKARGLAERVVGVGRRQSSLDQALVMGAIDAGTLDLAGALPEADLVVLCTSVAAICRQAKEAIPLLARDAVLSDVGSVKGAVCAAVRHARAESNRSDVRFVGSHPLAGSEQRGVSAASSDLYLGATCILTPDDDTDADALASIRRMWSLAGCRVLEMAPEEHDTRLARISHLPHMAASSLVNATENDDLGLAAAGFMDTTRIASGDPELWRDICLLNRDAVSAALRTYAQEVERFAAAVDAADGDKLHALLAEAKRRRDERLAEFGVRNAK